MLELIKALIEGISALLKGICSLLKGIFSLLKGIFSLLEGIDSFFESINSIGSVSSKSQKQPQQSSDFDKTMKKIFAGLFLFLGFLISAAALDTIFDPYASPEEYEDMLTGFFMLGLLCLVGGIWLTVGIIQQNQWETEEQQKAESDRLREIFFRLVNQENGEMTVLRFAMEAQISGDQAKQYLDEYAKQYDATFNVGDEGEISYQFHLKRNSGTPILSNQPKNNSQKKQPNHSFEFRFPIQFSNPIASKEKPSHPPAESPTPSHSPAENIHSQTESPTEQPTPSQSIEDSHPPEDTKPSHSSLAKEQPQAENSLVDAISQKISEGGQLPIQFSNPLTSKTEQQNQSTSSQTDQDQNHPNLENAKQNLSNLFGKVSKMMK